MREFNDRYLLPHKGTLSRQACEGEAKGPPPLVSLVPVATAWSVDGGAQGDSLCCLSRVGDGGGGGVWPSWKPEHGVRVKINILTRLTSKLWKKAAGGGGGGGEREREGGGVVGGQRLGWWWWCLDHFCLTTSGEEMKFGQGPAVCHSLVSVCAVVLRFALVLPSRLFACPERRLSCLLLSHSRISSIPVPYPSYPSLPSSLGAICNPSWA